MADHVDVVLDKDCTEIDLSLLTFQYFYTEIEGCLCKLFVGE